MPPATLFNPTSLTTAYRWLCRQRAHYPPHADVWHVRRQWPQMQQALLDDLLAGNYRFEAMQRIRKADGSTIHLWSARDALVLKMMAMGLGEALDISEHCTHVKGHGGLKQTVVTLAGDAAHGDLWRIIPNHQTRYFSWLSVKLVMGSIKISVMSVRFFACSGKKKCRDHHMIGMMF